MYSEPDKTTFFTDLKNLVVEYIRIRLELIRLSAYEKIARIITYLVLAIVAVLFFILAVFFLSLTLASYLGELLQSRIAGYAIVAGLYFLLFIIVSRSGNRWLGKKITNGVLHILFEQKAVTEEHENGENR